MQVKYIADHVKVDSIPGIGLRWEPGQTREVTSTVAAELLQYSDTWEEVKGAKATKTDEEEPIDLKAKPEEEEEPLAIVDFHGMNKGELLKFAEEKWNWRPNKNWSEGVIRERVIKRHTQEQM